MSEISNHMLSQAYQQDEVTEKQTFDHFFFEPIRVKSFPKFDQRLFDEGGLRLLLGSPVQSSTWGYKECPKSKLVRL